MKKTIIATLLLSAQFSVGALEIASSSIQMVTCLKPTASAVRIHVNTNPNNVVITRNDIESVAVDKLVVTDVYFPNNGGYVSFNYQGGVYRISGATCSFSPINGVWKEDAE